MVVFEGAVHTNQTDAPPALPPWFGSPVSLFAPTVVPFVVRPRPVNSQALAKLLFAGCARAVLEASTTTQHRRRVRTRAFIEGILAGLNYFSITEISARIFRANWVRQLTKRQCTARRCPL